MVYSAKLLIQSQSLCGVPAAIFTGSKELLSVGSFFRCAMSGILSNSFLIGILRPPLLMALSSIESSPVPFDALDASGMFADSFATSSVMVKALNFSSASAYFLTVSSNCAPWNDASAGAVFITLMMIPCAKAHSNAGRIVSSSTSPFS